MTAPGRWLLFGGVSCLAALGPACGSGLVPLPESTTTTIASTGGTAVSADGLFQVWFPSGAVADGTEITILTLARDAISSPELLSRVYQVSPADLVLAHPAEVRYAIPAEPPRGKEARIAIFDGHQPRPLDSSYQRAEGWIRAEVESLAASRFAAMLVEVLSIDELAWNASPGTGRVFVIDDIAIASKDDGLDLDRKCDLTTFRCVDNALWRLGELGNERMLQNLLGGVGLVLLEVTGIEEAYVGDDDAAVVKVYAGRDADDPILPANNFQVPEGETTCCAFAIEARSIDGLPPQARTRSPIKMVGEAFRSIGPTTTAQFTLGLGDAPFPETRLEIFQISGRLPATLDRISDGFMGGAITVGSLARSESPFCRVVGHRCPVQFTDATLLDLVSTLLGPQPDLDLDGDGLECVIDTEGDGAVDLCCDGQAQGSCIGAVECAPGNRVLPVDPNRPESCALDPRIADGYSIAYSFTAVPATIVGVR